MVASEPRPLQPWGGLSVQLPLFVWMEHGACAGVHLRRQQGSEGKGAGRSLRKDRSARTHFLLLSPSWPGSQQPHLQHAGAAGGCWAGDGAVEAPLGTTVLAERDRGEEKGLQNKCRPLKTWFSLGQPPRPKSVQSLTHSPTNI